jgi:hypothetical protein
MMSVLMMLDASNMGPQGGLGPLILFIIFTAIVSTYGTMTGELKDIALSGVDMI